MESAVARVRTFNRFYTTIIGALAEGHLDSGYSLAEVRVMYELAHHDGLTATILASELALDGGYLSRLLASLSRRRLVSRARSKTDGRVSTLSLTARGRAVFAGLDRRASDRIESLLASLGEARRAALLTSMASVQGVLDPAASVAPYTLRAHRSGDMGWVVERHGTLYHSEYGWDVRFEALVARICADFIEHLDPSRERCWIAERSGERVGSVFVVQHPEHADVAKLRLLLVEPSARGLGLGRRLVRECTDFAREAGYRAITLWTNDVLVSARKIYEAEGYRLVSSEPHRSYGHALVAQTWEKVL